MEHLFGFFRQKKGVLELPLQRPQNQTPPPGTGEDSKWRLTIYQAAPVRCNLVVRCSASLGPWTRPVWMLTSLHRRSAPIPFLRVHSTAYCSISISIRSKCYLSWMTSGPQGGRDILVGDASPSIHCLWFASCFTCVIRSMGRFSTFQRRTAS